MAHPGQTRKVFRFDGFELDLRTRELCRNGLDTGLPEQSIRILALLLESPGDVVLREEIRKELWPNDTVVEFDHSINAAMKRLRQALGDSADNPRYIELWRAADTAGRFRCSGRNLQWVMFERRLRLLLQSQPGKA